MDDRQLYLQLLAFATGPATEIVQTCFEVKVLVSRGIKFEIFLDNINTKHVLFHQYFPRIQCCRCAYASLAADNKRGCLQRNQFVQLYNDSGVSSPGHEQRNQRNEITQLCLCKVSPKSSVTVASLDIILLCNIIEHCCTSKPLNTKCLHDIKGVRNVLFHCGNGQTKKVKFNDQWGILETATLELAGELGSVVVKRYKRDIGQLKKSSVPELIEAIKDSNEDVKELLHILNGLKPIQTVIDKQHEHDGRFNRLENQLGELLEKFNNFKTTVQITEPNQTLQTTGHDFVPLECEANSQALDEHKAALRLSKTDDNADKKCFNITSAEKKCLLLKLTSNREIFQNEESLRYAIRSLIEQIIEAGEIDTSTDRTMTIKLAITSSSVEERKVVRSMLSKYGTMTETNVLLEPESDKSDSMTDELETEAKSSPILNQVYELPMMTQSDGLLVTSLQNDFAELNSVESSNTYDEPLKNQMTIKVEEENTFTDQQDVIRINIGNITCEMTLTGLLLNREPLAIKEDTDVYPIEWTWDCPNNWDILSIVDAMSGSLYVSSHMVHLNFRRNDENEQQLIIRTETQRQIFNSVSSIEMAVQSFVSNIITECKLQTSVPVVLKISAVMLRSDDEKEVGDEDSSDAIGHGSTQNNSDDEYTVVCKHCNNKFECYKCFEKDIRIAQLSKELSSKSTTDKSPGDRLVKEVTELSSSRRNVRKHQSKNPWMPNFINYTNLFISSIVLLLAIVMYYLYDLHLQTIQSRRVITPLAVPKVNAENSTMPQVNPQMYWGTYRANLYFGMKTRSPRSPVVGLMWFEEFPGDKNRPDPSLRHWCKSNDFVMRYGWKKHDGKHFGIQEIVDKTFTLTTSFVKRHNKDNGGDWSWRISVLPKDENKTAVVSLFVYVALDGEGTLNYFTENDRITYIDGSSRDLGDFVITFPPPKTTNTVKFSHLSVKHDGFTRFDDLLLNYMTGAPWNNTHFFTAFRKPRSDIQHKQRDMIVYQVTGVIPLEIDVVYEAGTFKRNPYSMKYETLTHALNVASKQFDDRFASTFDLKAKGFSIKEIDFAKAAMSNLLGEISYFYGASRVKSVYNKKPVDYWQTSLYTSIPSRKDFPRGFLWNVGFDNLLISLWDPKITEEIISHWLDLLNKDGWIPREQILGNEAKSRCPEKFIVQDNKNANPPTLFLTFKHLIRRGLTDNNFLEKIFPRLKAMFYWFNTSQSGELPSTYYWRGRHYETSEQINPLTPSSGFDDYPRANIPNAQERHLDLRCWMALSSGAMADIGKKIKKEWEVYEDTHQLLVDNEILDKYHWSSSRGMYSDVGFHQLTKESNSHPKLSFINSFGYSSLFPLMLRIIDPDSARLTKMLTDIKRKELLWTNFGLRSLAKNSTFYQLSNTATDPPYWRGSIWINMNYLTLSGLYHYRTTPGKNQKLATDIYNDLRKNIISNVFNEYIKRGSLFEQYDDQTGKGTGSHPFSGWSALIVAIMAEEY